MADGRGLVVAREPARSTYMATTRLEVNAYRQQIARFQEDRPSVQFRCFCCTKETEVGVQQRLK